MRYRFLCFPNGRKKAVTFSYDDGCRNDIRFSETLLKFGLKCTFNINSGFLGKDRNDWYLTPEEIKEYLLSRGFEIANHGELHRANGLISSVDGIRDVLNCRSSLEKTFGGIIRGMAYPDTGINNLQGGVSYQQIKQYLSELGIVYSRTTINDHSFRLPTDWHAWNPTCHHSNSDTISLIDEFLDIDSNGWYIPTHYPRLFYLWGHSYEFDKNNNWSFLDEICEKLSGKEDIWYATNMEIYEYVSAYQSLVFSADGTVVYNPTLLKIWFEVDGVIYSIDPDKQIRIGEKVS